MTEPSTSTPASIPKMTHLHVAALEAAEIIGTEDVHLRRIMREILARIRAEASEEGVWVPRKEIERMQGVALSLGGNLDRGIGEPQINLIMRALSRWLESSR